MIAHNGLDGENDPILFETRTTLDIEGNLLEVTDANGHTAELNTYATGGLKLKTESQDAGTRWALPDAQGRPLRAWDSRDNVRRWTYDALSRPTHAYLKHDTDDEVLQQRIVYGESLGTGAATTNHRGQVYRVYDGAGCLESVEYDFKGNLLETERRLAEDYTTVPDWSDLASETDPGDIHTAAAALIESETFSTSWTYDALNRVLTQTTPDDSVTTQTFGAGGLLQSVAVNIRGAGTATDIVTNIDYNARGQRTLIEYGNGSETAYEYDPRNFRVTRIHTERPNDDPDLRTVQDLRYHYDPVGNIARIRDHAQQGVFFDNAYVDPTQSFKYDPTYRLIEATGREHATLTMPTPEGLAPIAHPQDTQAQRGYTQLYTYDPVGNIARMTHKVSGVVDWARGYDYVSGGNQLRATSDPLDDIDDPESYTVEYEHDAHGNMTAMPHIPGGLTWDHDDRLQKTDHGGGGVTYFVYDGAGQRVRKVHVNYSGTTSKQRLYFGSWETHREHKNIGTTNDLDLERETLHVHDDHGRVCLIETLTVEDEDPIGSPANVARYQYSNHLGTANLELDDSAEVISYEEFHPYGTSSYRAANGAVEVSAKRYRYTGQERDEETGFAYHGARYYAPWLARWTAADPAGLVDGPNRYLYARARPIVARDPSGTRAKSIIAMEDLHVAGQKTRPKSNNSSEARGYDGPTAVEVPSREKQDPNVGGRAAAVRATVEDAIAVGVGAAASGVNAALGWLSNRLERLARAYHGTAEDSSGRRSIGAHTRKKDEPYKAFSFVEPPMPRTMDAREATAGVVVTDGAEPHRAYDDLVVDPWQWRQLPSDLPGIKPVSGKEQWGRPETIEALERVGAEWAKRHPDHPIQIGDISKKGGGQIVRREKEVHRSHLVGLDVDVRIQLKDPKRKPAKGEKNPPTITSPNYSRELTRELIEVFEKSAFPDPTQGSVEYIYFSDPELKPVTNYDTEHFDHFHVRFYLP